MSTTTWLKRLARNFGMKGLVYTTLAVLLGSAMGLGLFTFGYAKGFSYLGNDPKTCNNCHAMNDQYDGWLKGSHHHVAGCNDCHAPHDNLVHKYAVKAENGFWHSLKFTTQDYPLKIKIRESNRKVTEEACLYCHESMVSGMHATRDADQKISCIKCHSQVGHKR